MVSVVFGMRLIRRPWKGCQFWDVPFTIPCKGCKFQKWGLRKWGYRIWFFEFLTCCTCCRMIIRGGGGWGGCINVLDEHFLYVTEDAHVAHAVVWSSGGWGWGVGGCINVPDEHFLYVTEDANVAHAVSCVKDYPHKRFKLAQVNRKQKIFSKTKTYLFRGRLWDKSYRAIVAGTQQMDGTWKHLKKWRPPSMLHKKKRVQKKIHLGLQLDMASQPALLQTVASALPQALWHR